MNELYDIYTSLAHAEGILLYISFAIRFLLPILALLLLFRCGKSLLSDHPEDEIWGYLVDTEGNRLPLRHFENTIGSAKSSDVVLEDETIDSLHAFLIRDGHGEWLLHPAKPGREILCNGEPFDEPLPVFAGDRLTFGAVTLVFAPSSEEDEQRQAVSRTKPGGLISPGISMFILTEFQLLLCSAHWIAAMDELNLAIPICFGALIVICWCYYFFMRALRRMGFEIEILAFFLVTIGMSVCATSTPDELYEQAAFLIVGLLAFLILGWFLRDLGRIKTLRLPVAVMGVLLLGVNLVLASRVFGARNWISIGGFSFQPSEFVKICFLFAGAATLDKLFSRKNLFWFVAFSGVNVIALVLMSDFGTASVFFVAYLIMAFLRSGDIATVILSISGAGFAGFMAITIKPYIAGRFSTWLHAWDYANEGGYQQTRTMMAAANGGLFGVGAGSGGLYKIFAADTDMVFGMVCEELGLLVGLSAIACFVILTLFVIRSAKTARSSFHVIGACGALAMMIFQIMLNVLGAFDILPFTGVTFPFLSKGGSSLLSCFCLLAFIKAADTRQNASFAVRLPKRYRKAVKQMRYDLSEEDDQ